MYRNDYRNFSMGEIVDPFYKGESVYAQMTREYNAKKEIEENTKMSFYTGIGVASALIIAFYFYNKNKA